MVKLRPQNLPEALIFYYIIFYYFIYLIGAQFVFAPLLALFLAGLFINDWLQDRVPVEKEQSLFPSSTWVWVISVLVIELALIIGHLDFGLGISGIIESSVNRWLRSWALLALFPIAGNLKIRPEIIYRATCIFCIQGLVLVVLAIVLSTLGFREIYYVSPLRVFGGGSLSYSINLIGVLYDQGEWRLALFAPWSPALALTANVFFFLTIQEKNKVLRIMGATGAVAMIFCSISRLGMICLPFVLLTTWIITKVLIPWVHFLLAILSLVFSLFAPYLITLLSQFLDALANSRPGSNYVRSNLGKIALERWRNDAFMWGHGVMRPGPPIVAFMPIGTHHTWFSLLFTHGIVGTIALGVALLYNFLELFIQAQFFETSKVGLSILMVLIIFSVGENIDGLAYLYWPGLIILGIAAKEKIKIGDLYVIT